MTALLLSALFFLSGCSFSQSNGSETITFYYLKKEFDYKEHSSVIVPEERDSSEHRRDPSYLLALYLMGPVEETLIVPLPAGTKINYQDTGDGTVMLELTDAAEPLSDTEFSLACACLSLTCFDVLDAKQVTVVSGERTITMVPESLTLIDNSAVIAATEEKE